jgi:Tat protein translocase TatB subunit
MPTSLGPAEILVILIVALIVLGPKRLPEAGRQVGKALSEVRRWTTDVKSEIQSVVDFDGSSSAPSTVVEPVVVSAAETAAVVTEPTMEPREAPSTVVDPVTVSAPAAAVTVEPEAATGGSEVGTDARPESLPGDPARP